MKEYKDLIVVDGLQYIYWDERYFKMLSESGITAVHVTLAYHELARDTLSLFGKWQRFFSQ